MRGRPPCLMPLLSGLLLQLQLMLLQAPCAPASSSNGADGVRYIGNFGLSAVGSGLERLSVNPSATGEYLTNVGNGTLYITTSNGTTIVVDNKTSSVWPELALMPQHGLSMTAFAPISPRNSSLGFLPAVVMRWSAQHDDSHSTIPADASASGQHVAYVFDCDPGDISSPDQPSFCPGFFASSNVPSVSCGAIPPPARDIQRFCVNVSISAGGRADLVIGYFDGNGVYATPGAQWYLGIASAADLSSFVLDRYVIIRFSRVSFSAYKFLTILHVAPAWTCLSTSTSNSWLCFHKQVIQRGTHQSDGIQNRRCC